MAASLRFVVRHWRLILFVICLVLSFGAGTILLMAWHEVRNSPREVMMICQVHGPRRKSQIITFIDQPYCDLCWFAKNQAGKRNFQ